MVTGTQLDIKSAIEAARRFDLQPRSALSDNERHICTLGSLVMEIVLLMQQDLDDYEFASEVKHIITYGVEGDA